MWTLVAVICLLFLFGCLDVWYFIRLLPILPKILAQHYSTTIRILSREGLLCTSILEGVVLPSDLDLLLHMNNSKYLREMDFGRFSHFMKTNLYFHVKEIGTTVVLAAAMIRYRRSLKLWQRFQLQTCILGWDDSSFYCEQRFVNKQGFVCAIALIKMFVRGRMPSEVLEKAGVEGYYQSPPFPRELKAWTEAIRSSSEALKNELTILQ